MEMRSTLASHPHADAVGIRRLTGLLKRIGEWNHGHELAAPAAFLQLDDAETRCAAGGVVRIAALRHRPAKRDEEPVARRIGIDQIRRRIPTQPSEEVHRMPPEFMYMLPATSIPPHPFPFTVARSYSAHPAHERRAPARSKPTGEGRALRSP